VAARLGGVVHLTAADMVVVEDMAVQGTVRLVAEGKRHTIVSSNPITDK